MDDLIVSIIVIALNEEKALPILLSDIEKQNYNHQKIEIILIDSLSCDQTKQIMIDFSSRTGFYKIVYKDNSRISLASGWNIALACLEGDIVIRLDAHATIPADFVQKNVECITKGHDICGGIVKNYMREKSNWGKVINIVEDSMFGGSVAAFRRKDTLGFINTLAFAAYRKDIFNVVGPFNEKLIRTEDNEIHYRMRNAGYKLFYTPEIVSYRETRPTFCRLLKQKYLNGYWIGLTMGICSRCFSLYHFIPFGFVLAIIITTILAFYGIWQLAVLMWALYIGIVLLITILLMVQKWTLNFFYIVLPVLFLFLHISYGLGILIGLIYMPFWIKK